MTKPRIGIVLAAVSVLVAIPIALLSLRKDSHLLALALLVTLFIPKFRRNSPIVISAASLVVLSIFSPIGITYVDAPGPPKLVECCPGMPLRYREIRQDSQAGKCAFCSDLISGVGVQPRRYVVW